MVFRRGLRPVRSIKHIVDSSGGLVAGSTSTTDLINTVADPDLSVANAVADGSTVHSIFLKVEGYATNTAGLANMYMLVFKNPGANLTGPNASGAGIVDEKRFIIHQEMVMLEKNTTGNPRTLFHGVIKIPRSYKRNGIKDKLQLLIKTVNVTGDFCAQCIYKEFR